LEPLVRNGHGDGLVGAAEVVVGHPGIQHLLGLGEGVKAPVGQQLNAQGLVESLDLAGRGGTADPGAQVGDAAFAADAVEQHLTRVGAKAAGEHLAVEFLMVVKVAG
jgi:hypothetical protein